MGYKLYRFCENRPRDTPRWVKFGMEEGTFGTLLHAKFHLHRCNLSPIRGEKPQNQPLSKLNTGRLALRAMLPVMIQKAKIWLTPFAQGNIILRTKVKGRGYHEVWALQVSVVRSAYFIPEKFMKCSYG